MNKIMSIIPLAAVIGVVVACIGCGGGYKLQYELSEKTAAKSAKQLPLSVAVVQFEDDRDYTEREKDSREAAGISDAGDYTRDKDFRGQVASEITDMVTKHLRYSGVFEHVTLTAYERSAVNPIFLDSLARSGVDAVLYGRISHFSGYYDHKTGRYVLFVGGTSLAAATVTALLTTKTEKSTVRMPFSSAQFEEVKVNTTAITAATTLGSIVGAWLESVGKRDVGWHTQLSLELVSTRTGSTLWTATGETTDRKNMAIPGVNTASRKQQVAVQSLRVTVNDLIRELSDAEITVTEQPALSMD
ncbi:hypothetical protein GF420_01570 [candidate division GN15 bacterium]|nr:hypothetical protein [candidate division GN15 bacterium]